MNYKKMKIVLGLPLAGGIAVAILGFLGYLFLSWDLPKIITLTDYEPPLVTQIVNIEGDKDEIIGELFTERRYLLPIEKLPEKVIRAFVSAEDDTFFEHQGISPLSIVRAFFANLKAGHVVQGGSTITQQVAKSLFLSPERNLIRKAKEFILAERIERTLTKQQILYLYLNQIYLGQGAYGIEAAAQVYFHKRAADLALGEAALLAGLPRAPSKYNPFSLPKRAKERQLYVLRRMFEDKVISQQEMLKENAAPLKVFYSQEPIPNASRYLVEQVRQYLVKAYGEKAVLEDGLRVVVPASLKNLKASYEALREGLKSVDKRRGFRGPIAHLIQPDEVKTFLEKQREELIRERVPYAYLLSDGRLGIDEALRSEGIKDEKQILIPGKIHQAYVDAIDDKAKFCFVKLGRAELKMPMDQMAWAKPETADGKGGRVPTIPSHVVKQGDIVWVRVVRDPADKSGKNLIASLEQTPKVQGALISFDLETGQLLSLLGGYDFDTSQFNRAIQAQRQPGSAFKPLIFSAAIERGFTAASIIIDSPLVFSDEESGKWRPSNYNEKFEGDTTLAVSLAKSRNIPTIKLVESLGVQAVIDQAHRMGFTGKFNPDLSMALGSSTVSLLEIVKVYASFARLGKRLEPVLIKKVFARDGRLLEENKSFELRPEDLALVPPPPVEEKGPEKKPAEIKEGNVSDALQAASQLPTQLQKTVGKTFPPDPSNPNLVLDPRVAYVMTHLLRDVVLYGTGADAKVLPREIAGKTGTTNDYNDAWFIGFSPHVVTGVRVGFDDLKNSIGPGETGTRAALPIWIQYMKEAISETPETRFKDRAPPGVVFATIDPSTGRPLASRSKNGREEAFVEGTEPRAGSSVLPASQKSDTESDFLKETYE